MNVPHSEAQQRERIPTEIFPSADLAARELAQTIARLIRNRAVAGRSVVLGLATGSTPVRLYRELIRLHREEDLSFRNVVTYNLDEYYGLPRTHPESYWRFMHEQLFDHIDIPAKNIHLPDGTVPRSEVFAACQRYEAQIAEAGGIDLQVLGIGRTGHIGFNEPGSSRDSRTRLLTLDQLTRRDAARDFLGEANVPRHAITMGVGTILAAREIVLLAWGSGKASIVARAVEEPPTDALPASFLQSHPRARVLIDEAAAAQLTRRRLPWLVGPVEWTPPIVRSAVVWLAQTVDKPVLKLVDEHYSENGMADLLTEQGPAYGLNIRIFNELQHTITGWPGGKPDSDDRHRPERARPFPKRVLVLSPEPSHDVIGMGGTLRRLIEQGHEVTVAYLTSGNLAVPDEEAAMAADFMADVARTIEGGEPVDSFAAQVRQQLARKNAFESDAPAIRQLKGLLRHSEARAALQASGVDHSHVQFLELGFYKRGRYRQFSPDATDVTALATLLRSAQPHQIFATGESDDPSSVTAVCFDLLRRSLQDLRPEPWTTDCQVWLYRGADATWDAASIDMAVPLSPHELAQKIQAIYQHKTQRSQTAGGPDFQQHWEMAEQQNRALAKVYDALGLADYEAIEAFTRWCF